MPRELTVNEGAGTVEDPWYHLEVQLVGEDSNVFNLIGICTREMRRAGVPSNRIDEFREEVGASGSFDEALQVMMRWVDAV